MSQIKTQSEQNNDRAAVNENKGYRLTLMSNAISDQKIAQVTAQVAAHGLAIKNTTWLSEPATQGIQCVELAGFGVLSGRAALKDAMIALADQLCMDIVLQDEEHCVIPKKLVVFDMDSTLIKAEVIDELAVEAGIGAQVAEITEQAMQGKIDFQESFRRRLKLLKGLDESALEQVGKRLVKMDGAEILISNLRKLGYKTAIVSGGFTWFANRLKQQLGMDYAFANQLDVVNGKVTGEAGEDIIDAARKAQILRQLANRENIELQQVIAVGDGANDLKMLAEAGLGIAFRAKPLVRASASHAVTVAGLDGLLYVLGYSDKEIARL